MRFFKRKKISQPSGKSGSVKNKSSDEEGSWFSKNRARLIILLVFVILVTLFFPSLEFKQYLNFRPGTIAYRDVIAPFTFYIYKSKQELNRDREEARRRVLPIFQVDPSVAEKELDRLNRFFDELRLLRKSGVSDTIRIIEILSFCRRENIILTEKDAHFFNKLELAVNQKSFSSFENEMQQILQDIYAIGVINRSKSEIRKINPRIYIKDKDQHFEKDLNYIYDMKDARERILERFKARYRTASDSIHAAYALTSSLLKPNVIYDAKETNRLIHEAIAGVPLVKGQVLKGEIILQKHQRITPEQIDALRSLEKAQADKNAESIYWELFSFYVGTLFFILIALFPLLSFIYVYRPKIFNNNNHLIIILGSMLLVVALAFFVQHYGITRYVVPVAVVPMMITYYFDNRVSLLSGVSLSILVAGIFANDFTLLVISIFVSAVGVVAVGVLRGRKRLTNSVFLIGSAYFFSLLFLGIAQQIPIPEMARDWIGGLLNGVISAVLVYGLLLLFDYIFNVCSEYKLIELSDLSHPLLKMLAVRAPGTYNHSIVISNLVEAAGEAIRANSLLAKVGAYYHDIGKMYMPEYFIENQRFGKNPHESLAPRLSSLILQNHVKKGLEFANQYHLPAAIKDFIAQHHGTSLMKFFYEKALTLSKGVPVNEADFRYQGVKPRTRETGILMLADNIEALTRSVHDINVSKIRNAIHSVVEEKLQEGQLDECPLTMRELQIISKAFEQNLIGVHHARIEYPGQEKMISGKKTAKSPQKAKKSPEKKVQELEDKGI